MKNRVKAELLVLWKNKIFIWISCLTLAAVGYSFYTATFLMEVPEEGGYYTYTILSLAYLIGITEPVAIGSFFGGYDEYTGMSEYKLCGQSWKKWMCSKAAALISAHAVILSVLTLVGLVTDFYRATIYGSAFIIVQRFTVVFFVWLLWGFIGFTAALVTGSPGLSFTACMIVYYGEQYIGRFVSIPCGLLWNQKSLERHFFHADEIPFGVVQTYYIGAGRSGIYLVCVLFLSILISVMYMKRRYPQK